jgi:hypothetical protein
MIDNANMAGGRRNIWIRAIFMLLLGLAFQLCGTVLFIVAFIQFAMTLMDGTPNTRLVSLGRSMGIYMRDIAMFMTFATEEMPFPFKEWPTGE